MALCCHGLLPWLRQKKSRIHKQLVGRRRCFLTPTHYHLALAQLRFSLSLRKTSARGAPRSCELSLHPLRPMNSIMDSVFIDITEQSALGYCTFTGAELP